jgi:hypothetical protein
MQLVTLLKITADSFPLAFHTSERLNEIKQLVDMYAGEPASIALIPMHAGWAWELADATIVKGPVNETHSFLLTENIYPPESESAAARATPVAEAFLCVP